MGKRKARNKKQYIEWLAVDPYDIDGGWLKISKKCFDAWVFDTGLSANAIIVLLLMCYEAKENYSYALPRAKWKRKKSDGKYIMSNDTFAKAIAELEEKNVIKVERYEGGQNRYTFTPAAWKRKIESQNSSPETGQVTCPEFGQVKDSRIRNLRQFKQN